MKHLLLLLTFAATSFGAVIYSDDFDTSLPATVLNANVPGWEALNGTVDYGKNGAFGLSCRGGAGGCIDLDGTTRSAADFTSLATFNLLAGNTYTLTYWFSGSQRTGPDSMMVSFGGQTNTHADIPASAPFSQFSLLVAPLVDTTSNIVFSHAGGDDFGLILDDVSLDESPAGVVPEPSSLLLLSGGLGILWARRKRK
ncbi:MAG: PEP-CTERM sorting domain-containing protein [Bryobacteraceae bacterium]|nr:PEP-CTERM sorting domain-containing protein [Bryobacteraceae bacterium]